MPFGPGRLPRPSERDHAAAGPSIDEGIMPAAGEIPAPPRPSSPPLVCHICRATFSVVWRSLGFLFFATGLASCGTFSLRTLKYRAALGGAADVFLSREACPDGVNVYEQSGTKRFLELNDTVTRTNLGGRR